MLKFQWNALRRGDHVLVHDSNDAHLSLRAGVVTLVDTHRSGHEVGVRFTTGTPTAYTVRPGRMAVHFDPIDDDDDCWRCNDNRARTCDIGVGRGVGFSHQRGR
jgi:hypothetical protein